jgi:hypothetical protein
MPDDTMQKIVDWSTRTGRGVRITTTPGRYVLSNRHEDGTLLEGWKACSHHEAESNTSLSEAWQRFLDTLGLPPAFMLYGYHAGRCVECEREDGTHDRHCNAVR